MKLYYSPVSTASRPVLMFIADNDIDIDLQLVDLMSGEHMKAPYLALNPSGMVPLLEDGDFRLTESSAILKYLADKIGSPAYPKDLRQRARVNERMDWLNTQFYRDYGYGLVYPQVFPHHKRPTEDQQSGVVNWGRDKSQRWLKVLDQSLIGSNPYLCGSEITIADYLGTAFLSIGEILRCNFSAYPNVERWLNTMKARPNWAKVNKPFYDVAGRFKDKPFVAI
ncbi:MAG TPA: glutathione S-transferase family protein [Sphingomonadaceae bacterium]|nr:glutathione S-transferase family protein [Sphingomonadaceae bacterium]